MIASELVNLEIKVGVGVGTTSVAADGDCSAVVVGSSVGVISRFDVEGSAV